MIGRNWSSYRYFCRHISQFPRIFSKRKNNVNTSKSPYRVDTLYIFCVLYVPFPSHLSDESIPGSFLSQYLNICSLFACNKALLFHALHHDWFLLSPCHFQFPFWFCPYNSCYYITHLIFLLSIYYNYH